MTRKGSPRIFPRRRSSGPRIPSGDLYDMPIIHEKKINYNILMGKIIEHVLFFLLRPVIFASGILTQMPIAYIIQTADTTGENNAPERRRYGIQRTH